MKFHWVTWFFACFVLVSRGDAESIQCPIPGNPSTVTEEECVYAACVFIDEECVMGGNDAVGYYVAGETQITEAGAKVPISKPFMNATLFGADVEILTLEVIRHEAYHLQIKIYDPSNERFQVPFGLNLPSAPDAEASYDVTTSDVGEPFVLKVSRKSKSTTIFETVGPLTFEDQFLQFSVRLPSEYFYGLGENYHTSLMHSFVNRSTYPIFARDRNTQNPGEYNHYGSHPYYVSIENDDGDTHSVLLYSSNAIEYSTFLLNDGSPAITFRSIGGIIDLHFFLGPSPEDVNIQYANAVGKPNLPPYWALGFTLSRWNYGSSENYRIVRDRMKEARIPMDVQTFDIDYMDGRKDFTYDPVNWFDLPELVEELHADNVRVTLILDPAIAIDWDTYPPSQRGKDSDVYVRWISGDLVPDDQPDGAETFLVGRVWPVNRTVFPDYFKPETKDWWSAEISLFHDAVDFDALWIDMNEPSNFGTNTPGSLSCPSNQWDSPVYATLAAYNDENISERISDGTICMSTFHSDGNSSFLHYDVHNLYGFSETIATFESLELIFPGLRKSVLSRSTFPGSGRYATHWLGDNTANWSQMELSIVGMLEFNMFAMPMVGADICGFLGEPSMELCARWMQLGAFYPYSRNHNDDLSPDQDPAVWPRVAEISRNVLLLRYKFLPFLYSLLHRSNSDGNSVIRPLFNVFPSDLLARPIQTQFLWGDALMIAPILNEGTIAREVYFPKSLWYRIDSGQLVSSGEESKLVAAALDHIPVYVRGGSILPFQNPAETTTESRSNAFGFLVPLNVEGLAAGEVFWDDGVSDLSSQDAFFATFSFNDTTFRTSVERNPSLAEGLRVSTVTFLGVAEPTEVRLVFNGTVAVLPWEYDSDSLVLNITSGVDVPLNQEMAIVLE